MLHLRYYPFDLAFEYPFTIAKGTKTHQPVLVVSLGLGQLRGHGEAPAIHYYNVSVPDMIATLEEKKNMIERYALTDPQRFWHFLHHLIPGQNFLIAALDIAGWDLFAQMRRMPLYRILGINWRPPVSDYTLGSDVAEVMIEKMKAHPSPVYKVKFTKSTDIDLLRALRLHTSAPFRIDANESLSFDDIKALLPELQSLGVDMIEQPLPKTDWEAMKELKGISPIQLFADESCVEEEDVALCADSFHGINIKLTKCGGITPALRMIQDARKLGLKVMLGTMNESTIGSAALAHIAPVVDALDADGPLLLKEDVADGLRYDNGTIQISGAPGLGIRFRGEKFTTK